MRVGDVYRDPDRSRYGEGVVTETGPEATTVDYGGHIGGYVYMRADVGKLELVRRWDDYRKWDTYYERYAFEHAAPPMRSFISTWPTRSSTSSRRLSTTSVR